ncbi:MAG: dTDP-4-dehydrorhamnose 3,5-epimerase [Bacteroidota bacterium]
MQINKTTIPDCYEIIPKIFNDERGIFVKTFRTDIFEIANIGMHFVEEYYSISHKRVLRGLHFQTPPKACDKMVYCVSGEVLDVVVDLRIGSPVYGKYETIELNSRKANILHIPAGLAHGFYVLSEKAILIYKTTSLYSPEHDSGIRWNSINFSWPDTNPIISKRDGEFVGLQDFKSPFVFKKNK